MVNYINMTGSLGTIYEGITYNITGSEFLTLFFIILLVMLFFMMFRIPIELSAVLILPLLIVVMAYSGEFFAITGLILIYLALLLAKNWFF